MLVYAHRHYPASCATAFSAKDLKVIAIVIGFTYPMVKVSLSSVNFHAL